MAAGSTSSWWSGAPFSLSLATMRPPLCLGIEQPALDLPHSIDPTNAEKRVIS
jgi:hypothetical protein